jgi:spore maturation protein CgeB
VERLEHVPPSSHSEFYAMSRFTLNVTREDMVQAGYSPSVRLFEAGACGTPILSDAWPGIDEIFVPGEDIMLVREAEDVLHMLLETPESRRLALAAGVQRRICSHHTSAHRAAELEGHLRSHSSNCEKADGSPGEKARS